MDEKQPSKLEVLKRISDLAFKKKEEKRRKRELLTLRSIGIEPEDDKKAFPFYDLSHGIQINNQPGIFGHFTPLLRINKDRALGASNKTQRERDQADDNPIPIVTPSNIASARPIPQSVDTEQISVDAIDDLDAYHLELKINFNLGSIIPCNGDLSTILLFDFDTSTKLLNKSKVVFVKPIMKTFTDKDDYVYQCLTHHEIFSELADVLTETFDDFKSNPFNTPCLHSQVVERCMKDLVKEYHGSHLNNVLVGNVVELPFIDGICLDASFEDYGIIIPTSTGLACITCKRGTHHCSHVNAATDISSMENDSPEFDIVAGLLEIVDVLSNDENQTRTRKPISKNKISLESNPVHQDIFRNGMLFFNNLLTVDEFGNSYLFLECPQVCPKCSKELSSENIHEDLVPFIIPDNILNAKVHWWCCLSCNSHVGYDGFDFAVVNMGPFFISHALLFRYLDDFESGCSLIRFHRKLEKSFSRAGLPNLKMYLSYWKLRAAWSHFLELLDVDLSQGFSCFICQDKPEIMLCDGTSLAFRQKLLGWENFLPTKGNSTKPKAKEDVRFADRLFLPTDSCRKSLAKYAESSMSKPLSPEDFTKLCRELEDLHEPHTNAGLSISNIIRQITVDSLNKPYCPPIYNFIFIFLSRASPVCATIPNSDIAYAILTDMANGTNITGDLSKIHLLSELCPIVFKMIKTIKPLPECLQPLFTELIKASKRSFPKTDIPQFEADEDDPFEDLKCFPALAVHRPRGNYVADKAKQIGTNCNKNFINYKRALLPGIFTIYCAHGICYGFQVMTSSESVNMPFTIFLTRFPEAPKVIVYDFCCALHLYSLKRAPTFFSKTKFLIDRFHWRNHKACAEGYCLDKYPAMKDLNTQINEQVNAGLKTTKSFLSYMTRENFVKHCSLFLWLGNREKLRKLSTQRNRKEVVCFHF